MKKYVTNEIKLIRKNMIIDIVISSLMILLLIRQEWYSIISLIVLLILLRDFLGCISDYKKINKLYKRLK
jgi:hypothetical protein